MKILIVEDEYAIALNTQLQLEDAGHSVIGIADNYEDVILFFEESIPDIILMDINLGERDSGIEIAQKLNENYQIPIIFVSAYSDNNTVQNALGVRPFGYLVKPYKKEDLLIAIQVAYAKWQEEMETESIHLEKDENQEMFFQNGYEIVKLSLDEIVFLQAFDNYTIIQTKKERIVTLGYLSQVVEKINCNNLIQTHRSYFVHKKHIDSIKSNTVYINEFKIPISRSFKKDILNQLP